MKKFFIIHGFEGRPNGGWRPWFMEELDALGVYACALPMPAPEAPQQSVWVPEIARVIPEVSADIFLVGHSLGVVAILRYLESLQSIAKFGGVFLVAGPFDRSEKNPGPHFAKLKNFFETPFQIEKIKNKSKYFSVLHGDNDDMVPFSHAEKLSKALDCELITIKNGGHLNRASGFTTLEPLLDAFRRLESLP